MIQAVKTIPCPRNIVKGLHELATYTCNFGINANRFFHMIISHLDTKRRYAIQTEIDIQFISTCSTFLHSQF